MSEFIKSGLKIGAIVPSENGAMKYDNTNNVLLTQFGSISAYRKPRAYDDISTDMSILWAESPLRAVQMTLFIRMISRTNNVTGFKDRGAGMRHEGINRFFWIGQKNLQVFEANLPLFISVGSMGDLIELYKLSFNDLTGNKIANVINNYVLNVLSDENQANMFKKYMPQAYSNGRAKTNTQIENTKVAKYLSNLMGLTPKEYRLFKSSGTAHSWQQKISKREYNSIDFNEIHGRALMLLSNGNFIQNHELIDAYINFLEKNDKLKYTGHIVDLFKNIKNTPLRNKTVDRQFMSTLDNIKSKFIVVRDTSGSMGSPAMGIKMSAFDVAKALALWFSYCLKGRFENSWIEFNNKAKLHTWKGSTPTEKWFNDKSTYVGSTNFMSVIELFGVIKREGVSEKEFPEGILCISDMEFNPAALNKTNIEAAKEYLKEYGFSETYIENFKIVLWNLCRGNSTKFETYDNHTNVFYFSGYSPEIIYFLNGDTNGGADQVTAIDAVQAMEAALTQPTLQLVQI